TLICSAEQPPAVAAASLASLALVRSGSERREHLQSLVQHFRRGAADLGYQLMPSTTPIQPLLIGADADALALSQALRDDGLLVSAIRPPTVPEGSARLRITLTAAHQQTDVDTLLQSLAHYASNGN